MSLKHPKQQAEGRKLRLNKETLRDLDAKRHAGNVKGGASRVIATRYFPCQNA